MFVPGGWGYDAHFKIIDLKDAICNLDMVWSSINNDDLKYYYFRFLGCNNKNINLENGLQRHC